MNVNITDGFYLDGDFKDNRLLQFRLADCNQFNRYELKLGKLVCRIDNLEKVLHSRFSEIENNLSKTNGLR